MAATLAEKVFSLSSHEERRAVRFGIIWLAIGLRKFTLCVLRHPPRACSQLLHTLAPLDLTALLDPHRLDHFCRHTIPSSNKGSHTGLV